MRIKNVLHTAMLGVVFVPAIALSLTTQEPEAPLDPRILAWDKGPAKVDVSKYPPDIRAGYKVFSDKCGKCHTPARAINCDFVLEDEWERYVKRMMRKAGSYISPDEGKRIYEFVVYDSKVRKKALYEKKQRESKSSGF